MREEGRGLGKPGIGASKPVRWEGVMELRYINYLSMCGVKGCGF